MNVKEVIAQADNLIGKRIDIEGELIVLQDGERYVTYIFSPDESHEEDEPHQIAVAYSIPKLKTMMRPLPSMQLIYRGKLTDAPYFWRFPIELKVQLDMDTDNRPVINRIFALGFDAPFATNFLDLLPQSHYRYEAQIDYDYEPEELQKQQAQAIIQSQRIMCFRENKAKPIILQANDNAYARNLLKQTVTIPGWLRYIADRKQNNHFVLRTFALRSSMFSVGLLKDLTSIWWKPSPLYQVIRAHTPIKNIEEINLQIAITGEIAYLAGHNAPYLIGGTQPKLVFTEIEQIVIHEVNFLH